MNAGQRLAALSGAPGLSAAEHLKRIAGAAGVAGALLVAYSQLPTGSAEQHLLAERQAQAPEGRHSGARSGHSLHVAEEVWADDEELLLFALG